jgi:hypothetical protein
VVTGKFGAAMRELVRQHHEAAARVEKVTLVL